MLDSRIFCPICGEKLRTVRKTKINLYFLNKISDYIERVCTKGFNHSIQIFSDENTNKIDLIKMSLCPKYSKFLEIDFVNKRCRILYFNNGKINYINIEKLIEPDFPDLVELKKKISLYTVFC